MATNDFLVVAPGPAPNVASQATYAADPIVTSGNVSGVAKSAIVNKAWRQSSIMAAVLAQFISDATGQNSVDDGTTATLLANFKLAMQGRLITVRRITATGTYTPSAGTKFVLVDLVGGGAGGGGTVGALSGQAAVGGGGGAGCHAVALLTTGFSGITVTIGAGGTAGVGAAGGNGGATSFGTLIVCPGGAGVAQAGSQTGPIYQAPGLGASIATGTATLLVNAGGLAGTPGLIFTSAAVLSGKGGDSPFGSGSGLLGSVVTGNSGTAGAAAGFGAGGGGGLSTAGGAPGGGGVGAPGVVFVYEYGGP